ncbi:MAG: hypothetical protein ABIH42_07045 [Planctomycetota bacterium]
MTEPEHIKEIHKIREKISAECDYKVKELMKQLKAAEKNKDKLIHVTPTHK